MGLFCSLVSLLSNQLVKVAIDVTFIWFKPKYGANVMNKIIPSIIGFIVFLWVALSSTLAQEKNDLLQPEVDVEIGNEFSKMTNTNWSRNHFADISAKSEVPVFWQVSKILSQFAGE